MEKWLNKVTQVVKTTVLCSLQVLMLTCPFVALAAQEGNAELLDKDYILVVNSYAETTVESRNLISLIVAEADNHNLAVYVEHLNILMWEDASPLEKFRNELRAAYKDVPPKVLVMIENPSALIYEDIKELWGENLPIILCAEEDYMASIDHYLDHKAVLPQNRIPIERFRTDFNFTFLYANTFLAETVELIDEITPDMKKLVFVGDARQVNQQYDWETKHLLKKKYPGVEYAFYSTDSLSAAQLIDSLQGLDRQTTGILFSTWFHRQTDEKNALIMSNAHKVIAQDVNLPIFALKNKNVLEGMTGAVVYDEDKYGRQLLNTLRQVLAGVQPRDIPFYRPNEPVTFVNYPNIKRIGLRVDDFPSGAKFYERPPGFFEQYKYVMLGIVLVLLIGAVFQAQQRKLIAAQAQQLASYSEFMNLINNMPLCYLKTRVVKDAQGMPADFEVTQTNGSLTKTFGDLITVGQMGSQNEFFAGSMKEFKVFFKIVQTEKKNVSFSFYQKLNDKYYDVMLSRSSTPGHIDIFFRDYTEFHRMQRRLKSNNHKLTLALDVAKIIPWKIDITTNMFTYDDVHHEINAGVDVQVSDGGTTSVLLDEFYEAVHEEDRKRLQYELEELVSGRKENLLMEYRLRSIVDGEQYTDWIETRAVVEERDENGRGTNVVGSNVIITKRKEQEQELIQAKEHAEESNRLKTAFLANMSHEIRTPLNAIVGFSGILASTSEDEEAQEYAHLIETNNTLLLQLIGDILDLSKIESNSLDLFYSDFDLVHFMKGIEETMLQKMPTDKNLQLIMDEMPEVEYVHSEMNRLAQILFNMINNAFKFTNEGTVRFGYMHDDKVLRFHVTDTGIGIPSDKHEVIFDRFVKFNEFTQGTGLGLSVCKMIVENMGGEIGVNSVEGEGSRFWFTVPYQSGVSPDGSGTASDEVKIMSRTRLTILIAEDNDNNYNLFAAILKKDYNILHAWDGREAVELFREHEPHIVLMDINMPVMNGYEATAEIRKISPNVPIIAVTAYTFSETGGTADGQFNGFMNKPVNEQALKKELSGVLQRKFVLI